MTAETLQLPLWVEYTKALGAPIVAFLAACVAGIIANRQWVTARNKLKLDLFDRRMAIYMCAVRVLKQVRNGAKDGFSEIEELQDSATAARWLFDIVTAMHLYELALRIYKLTESVEQGDWYLFEEIYADERRALDVIFHDYLSLQH
jgi:hypothetical protein